MSIHELETEALKLAPEDQARLLHKLAAALDDNEPPLTNDELEKRWAEYEALGAKGIEASQLREQALRRYGLS